MVKSTISLGSAVLTIIMVTACGDDLAPERDGAVDAARDVEEADVVMPTPILDVLFLMRESIDERRLRDRLVGHLRGSLTSWFADVPELRVAVVGSDLGFRDEENRVCSDMGSGAELRRGDASCVFPSLFLDAGAHDDQGVRCLFQTPVFGCTAEQPLEAALAALSTEADPSRFFGNTRNDGVPGLGETANAGFRRRDAPLLLVIPTTEDDCSFMSRTFFADLTENFRVRCAERSDELHSPESYSAALSEIAPAGLHVFLLTGLPTDLVDASPATLVDDPRLAYVYDAETGQPATSCRSESLGRAFPPRRLIEFAVAVTEAPENSVMLGSMCDDAALASSFARLDEYVAVMGR